MPVQAKIFQPIIVKTVYLVFICTTLYYPATAVNSTFDISNITEAQVYISEATSFEKLQYEEQNYRVREKLLNESLIPYDLDIELTRGLANGVVEYILRHENEEEKITELSRLLQGPLGEYGSQEGEDILRVQKMSVIHEWLQRSIFGMSMVDWILNEITSTNHSLELNTLLFHEDLRRRLFGCINYDTQHGSLTYKARKYFEYRVLNESLPSFMWDFKDPDDYRSMRFINVTQPIFGHLHAGLKLLKDSEQLDNDNWSFDGVIDLGTYLELKYQNKNLNPSRYFELPAKVYCVTLLNYQIPRTFWGSCYESYFTYLQQSNIFMTVNDLLRNRKTRPQIALEELKKKNVLEDNLGKYLASADSDTHLNNENGENVLLRSPDKIYTEHIKEIRDASTKLDKLVLSIAFKTLEEDVQNFIKESQVKLVQYEIVNLNTPCAGLCYFPVYMTKKDVPRTINMLECQHGDEAPRVYALLLSNYTFYRVDQDKDAVIRLMEKDSYDKIIEDKGFKMLPASSQLLKEKKDDLSVLINKLANIHGDWLFKDIYLAGYEATFWQKTIKFALGLIPFYNCLKEPELGDDPNLRTVSCVLDVFVFIPFVGQASRVAFKFGGVAAEVSINALRGAARQATITQAIRQAGRQILEVGIPTVQKAVPSQVYINLGYQFLWSVDPGIGLIRLGGKGVINSMKFAGSKLRNNIPSLSKIATSLENQAIKYQKVIEIEARGQIISKTLPGLGQEVNVIKIGNQAGKDLYVQIDPDTNVIFGKRYTLDPVTGNLEMAPISFRGRVYNIKTKGLSGKGAQMAGKVWARDSSLMIYERKFLSETVGYSIDSMISRKAYEQASLVYRVDTRTPDEILQIGGFLPRQANEINFDMVHYSHLLESSVNNQLIGTPFISTTSDLDNVLQHLKSPYMESYVDEAMRKSIFDPSLHLVPGPSRASDHRAVKNAINKAREKAIEKLQNPPYAYVYAIRPDMNFYHRASSIIAAGDVSPIYDIRRRGMYSVGVNFADRHEYLALNKISKFRIISWKPVGVLTDQLPPVEEWEKNMHYNRDLDSEKSNINIYTHVGIDTENDAEDMGINLIQLALGKTKSEAYLFAQQNGISLKYLTENSHYMNDLELLKCIRSKVPK